MTSNAKTIAKTMTLRRKRRKRQIESMDAMIYCILMILLFAFTIFIISSFIEKNNKNNLQVKSTVIQGFSMLEKTSGSETPMGKSVSDAAISSVGKKAFAIPVTEEEISTTSTSENNFIIPITEYEIGLIVQAVQHEVGAWEGFYPDAELDEIQQIMARVIVNQFGLPGCGDSIYDVLFLHPGHFMPIEELDGIDPFEERTRKNVLKVLRGEDSHSSKVTIEMSFSSSCTFEESIEIMESQVGPVNPYFWTTTAEGRLLIFAESAT